MRWPSNHLIFCRPLLLPSVFPSIRVFSNESALHIRWPKYWNFSFNISPSNEHPGLISFRMDWLNLLVVQGTLTSLLQHHSSKASILRCSAFFIVQLSHPHMTTGKTIVRSRVKFITLGWAVLFATSCCYCCVVLVCLFVMPSPKVEKTGQGFALYETFSNPCDCDLVYSLSLNTGIAIPFTFAYRSCFQPLIFLFILFNCDKIKHIHKIDQINYFQCTVQQC